MKRLFIVLAVLLIVNMASAVLPPVTFNNANLRHDVMMQHVPPIDPNDTSRPNVVDMNGLQYLTSTSRGISDLTGLDTAKNLLHLRLDLNLISDVTWLSGLTKLTYLNLMDNHITNITPLAPLVNLQYLYLYII